MYFETGKVLEWLKKMCIRDRNESDSASYQDRPFTQPPDGAAGRKGSCIPVSYTHLYLDGGMEVAKNFILPFITEGKYAEADYKTRLQEIVQQLSLIHILGLVNPNTGHRPWANVQLRAENKERTLYNIVGFTRPTGRSGPKRMVSRCV